MITISEDIYKEMPEHISVCFNKIQNKPNDEVLELFPETGKGRASGYNFEKGNQDNPARNVTNIKSGVHFGDSGSAARFFYCAKASKKERNAGLDGFEDKLGGSLAGGNDTRNGKDEPQLKPTKNNHPTVKPIALMRYLCRLITPANGVVLDPFMGSGSTGIAAKQEGFDFIGIERDAEYCEIAKARIEND